MNRSTLKKLDRVVGPLALKAMSLLASFFEGRHDQHTFLVGKLVGLGDTLLMLPVLNLIRRTWPDAKIIAVVTPITQPLFIGRTEVDEIICYDVLGNDKGLSGLLRLARRIRRLRAGTYVDFEHYFLGTPFLGLFAGAVNRVGLYHLTTSNRKSLFSIPVYYDDQIHVIETYYKLYCSVCKSFGVIPLSNETMNEYRLVLPPAAQNQVYKWFERNSITKPIIGLHPGSGASGQFRRWPKQHFIELARRLVNTDRFAVVLTGAGEELPLLHEIQAAVAHQDCYLGIGLDFTGFLALLRSMSVYVSSDTGPVHIAPLLDTPTVGLFGPNTPARYGPRLQHSRSIYNQLPCSPCIQIHRGFVPTNCVHSEWGACMQHITVDDVWNTVHELLVTCPRENGRITH